jgi:hypothetical protein
MAHVNDKNFDELCESDKPVIVDFWAECADRAG